MKTLEINTTFKSIGNENNGYTLPEAPQPIYTDQILSQKWRQTKVLSSSESIINSNNRSPDLNSNNNNNNNNKIETTTFSTIVEFNNHQINNNNISGIDQLSLSTGSSTSTLSGNGSIKKKNLSAQHRYRRGSTIDKQKALRDKRANILREILSTEQAYISFLKILVEVYLAKIKDVGMTNSDIDGIFSNIEAIKCANDDILSKLKEKIENPINPDQFPIGVEISDVFLEFGPFLKIYSIYVNNYYNKAISIIKLNTTQNKKFKLYLSECKSLPASKKLDLNDLMIMPIQRLVRYVLLLEELIQHTPEMTEENEHKKLIEAKTVMKDVASFVNQSTVDKQGPLETLARVQQILGPKTGNLIQPHRRFIKSGDLVRVVVLPRVEDINNNNNYNNNNNNNSGNNENSSNSNNNINSNTNGDGGEEIIEKRTISIYLFNDLLIYAINNKFWRKIYLVEVWIRSKEIQGLENVFEVYSKSLSCVFQNQFSSNSSSSFEEWSTLIQSTINKLLESDSNAKEQRFNLLDQDDQIQKDFSFEERQFYFESLNTTAKIDGKIKKEKHFLIEDGIVEDRKKKIESLIIFQNSGNSSSQHSSSTTLFGNGNGIGNSDDIINEVESGYGGFSDNSDSEFTKLNSGNSNNSNTSNIGGSFQSDNSDSDGFEKKRVVQKNLKKRMQVQSSNRTSSSVQLFTQQLTKGKSSSLSHIVMTRQNVVIQGYLTKIGEVVKNWKRRWFVFENNYLFYLKNETTTKVLGVIPLIGSKIENIDQASFNITTNSRTYLIVADTQLDLTNWTKAILDFYSSRDNFINNIKQQYSSSPSSSSSSLLPSSPLSSNNISVTTTTTTTTTNTQKANKRLLWLSAALPNLNSLRQPQNDRSKTIANFRFSALLNENSISPDSLSKSVDAITCNNNNNNNDISNNKDNNNNNNNNNNDNNNNNNNNPILQNYDDCESLSSEESLSEEEFDE